MIVEILDSRLLLPATAAAMSNLEKDRSRREEYQQIIHECKNSTAISEQLISEYEERNEKLRKEINALKISNETEELDDDDKEIQIYKEKIESLTNELYEESTVIEDVEEVNSEDSLRVESLEKEIEQAKVEIARLKNEIVKEEEIKEQLQEKKVNFEVNKHRINSLTDDMNNLKAIVDDKKSQCESLLVEHRELLNENKIAESELASLKAGPIGEINRGNNLFSEVEENSENITFKKKQLTSKCSAKNMKLKQVISEVDKLKDEISELKKQGSNLCKQESTKIHGVINKSHSLLNEWEQKLSILDNPGFTVSSQTPPWIHYMVTKEKDLCASAWDDANETSKMIYNKALELYFLEIEKVEITKAIDEIKRELNGSA